MAEWQHILIDGPQSRAAIDAVLADLMGADAQPVEGGVSFTAPDAVIGVFAADYADEPQLAMAHYRWVVDIDGAGQVDWARRVFDVLAKQTRWSLLWQVNSIQVDARAGSAA